MFNPDQVTVTSASRSHVVATLGEVRSPTHAAKLLQFLASRPGIETTAGVYYATAQTLRLHCVVSNCMFGFDAVNKVRGHLGREALTHAPLIAL